MYDMANHENMNQAQENSTSIELDVIKKRMLFYCDRFLKLPVHKFTTTDRNSKIDKKT